MTFTSTSNTFIDDTIIEDIQLDILLELEAYEATEASD